MKILIIQCGGTIDKDYPKTDKGYAFEIGEPAAKRALSRVFPKFEFQIEPLLKKDSQEITTADRELLKETILASEANKILITHGTDTMIETGTFLQNIPDRTIVITGAFLPEKFKDSDADFNLGAAIAALQLLEKGTFIVMSGLIIPVQDAVKNDKTGMFGRRHS